MKLSIFLYIGMAFTGAVQGVLSSDEAAKYLTPEHLFWMRSGTVVLDTMLLAAKAWTSNGFQEWLDKRGRNPAIDDAAK